MVPKNSIFCLNLNRVLLQRISVYAIPDYVKKSNLLNMEIPNY